MPSLIPFIPRKVQDAVQASGGGSQKWGYMCNSNTCCNCNILFLGI